MKPLKRITMIGLQSLLPEAREQIELLADETVFCLDRPTEAQELINIIGNSEAILVSTHLNVTAEVISQCKELKYIGLYAKSMGHVDLDEAKKRKIVVSNFTESSSVETAEFCLEVLLEVTRGLSPLPIENKSISLENKQLGIIGFGGVGRELAAKAKALGLQVVYTSRTRKDDTEFQFQPLDTLLKGSDFVSLHVPAGTQILTSNEFSLMNRCQLLINSSLGTVLDRKAFSTWVNQEGKFAVFDEVAALNWDDLKDMSHVYLTDRPAWRTKEAIAKKDKQLIDNLNKFIREST